MTDPEIPTDQSFLATEEVGAADTTETTYEEVFETAEPDVLPVIKSLLDSAGIPWATHGESLMNLFPSETMSIVTLTQGDDVHIYVPESRAEEARALLSGDFTLTDAPPELANRNEPMDQT